MDDSLVAFLTARLDEDEVRARSAAEEWDDESARYEWEDLPDASFAHARCHSPARVLREVEADRKLLDAYQRAEKARPSDSWESDYTQALEDAVRFRASVHRDHPDYRQEWAP